MLDISNDINASLEYQAKRPAIVQNIEEYKTTQSETVKLKDGSTVSFENGIPTVKKSSEQNQAKGITFNQIEKQLSDCHEWTHTLGTVDSVRIARNRDMVPEFSAMMKLYNDPHAAKSFDTNVFSERWSNDVRSEADAKSVPSMKQEIGELQLKWSNANQAIVNNFDSLVNAFPAEAVRFTNNASEMIKEMANDAVLGDEAMKAFAPSMKMIENYQQLQMSARNQEMMNFASIDNQRKTMEAGIESVALNMIGNGGNCKVGDIAKAYATKSGVDFNDKEVRKAVHKATANVVQRLTREGRALPNWNNTAIEKGKKFTLSMGKPNLSRANEVDKGR